MLLAIDLLFRVQSTLVNTLFRKVNDFLLDVKAKFDKGEFTDEEFITQRTSVLTAIKEKDIKLSDEHNRYWKELTSHEKEFDRQNMEIEMI